MNKNDLKKKAIGSETMSLEDVFRNVEKNRKWVILFLEKYKMLKWLKKDVGQVDFELFLESWNNFEIWREKNMIQNLDEKILGLKDCSKNNFNYLKNFCFSLVRILTKWKNDYIKNVKKLTKEEKEIFKICLNEYLIKIIELTFDIEFGNMYDWFNDEMKEKLICLKDIYVKEYNVFLENIEKEKNIDNVKKCINKEMKLFEKNVNKVFKLKNKIKISLEKKEK